MCGRKTFVPFLHLKLRFQIYPAKCGRGLRVQGLLLQLYTASPEVERKDGLRSGHLPNMLKAQEITTGSTNKTCIDKSNGTVFHKYCFITLYFSAHVMEKRPKKTRHLWLHVSH